MFRVEYIRFKDHPQLGNMELFLSDNTDITDKEKPYTSILIGPNGTGKSFILKTISDILTEFNLFKTSNLKSFYFPFDFHLRYILDDDIYEIISSNLTVYQNSKGKRIFLFYKNRPIDFHYLNEKGNAIKIGYEIHFSEFVFPEHVIVNSVMLNDRFTFRKSTNNDFYQYLGARSTSSTASTKSSIKKTIENLINEIKTSPKFIDDLKELLVFLDFEEKFEIHYITKLNKLFFSGNLSVEDFRKYYEQWWDKDFNYTSRNKNNPIWSKPYYDKFFKNDENKTLEIVNFLNQTITDNILIHKERSRSKFLKFNFFDKENKPKDLDKILQLEKLDIINLTGIELFKNNSSLSINEISSGEYHLLVSLIGIFCKIKDNSLILIDEPEISLHPNWQLRYISFLKKLFKNYSGCHFILSSHSHFIISDLEDKNSSVTALKRDEKTKNLSAQLLKIDTYGWSAEDILYNIFNVKTVRNYFVEADLADLLGLISNNSKDKNKILKLTNKLKELNISDNDPLNAVLGEANEYIDNL